MLTEIISPALAVLVYMTVLFIIAQLLADNSIVDIGWGVGFVLVALLTLFRGGEWLPRPVITTFLVLLWGLRLSIYIFFRNRGRGEDFRYAKWRREWGRWFLIRSFFQIFMLQGFIMLVVSSSVIAINTRSGPGLDLLDLIGTGVWLVGFFFEAVGDRQLQRFKSDPANAGRVMDRGLWRYTRHPNYFGESVMWWGIFLLAAGVPGGWITVISPVTITLLLFRVSGVTMLEKALVEHRPGYREYVERTSPFLPRPPKGTGS